MRRCFKKAPVLLALLVIVVILWCILSQPSAFEERESNQRALDPKEHYSNVIPTSHNTSKLIEQTSHDTHKLIKERKHTTEYKKRRHKHFTVPYRAFDDSNHESPIRYLLSNTSDLNNIETEKGREILSRIKLNCRDTICSKFLTNSDEPHFKYCVRKTWNVSLERYGEPRQSLCVFMNGSNRYPMGLASYPGSGNTWVRGLFQKVTGLCTGGIYCDVALRQNGYPGESIRSGATFLVKSHLIDPRWEGVKYDSQSSFTYFKYREHVPVFSGGVFILRNPFHAMVAEFKREAWENSSTHHTSSLGKEHFGDDPKWSRFVQSEAITWQKTVLGWLVHNMNHPVMVVKYEDLKLDTMRELKRMLDFLQVPYSRQQLERVVREGYSEYRRSHKTHFEHYTQKQKQHVREVVTSTAEIIRRYYNISMLDYLEA